MTTSRRVPWWWQQPDHFTWISSYLRVREMAGMTRAVLVMVTLSLSWVPIGMLFSTSPPTGAIGTGLAVSAGVGGAVASLLWIRKPPGRNQSIAYALICSASISMGALSQSNPLTALMACTAFAAVSGYIALFHTPLLMMANLFIVVAVAATPAFALGAAGGVMWAVCTCTVVLVINIAVPYGVQVIVHLLGDDVLRADFDPLTGLLTRRAFDERARELLAHNDGRTHLVMAMIDLDEFKRLNDTRGHAEGDLVLAAVGHLLRGVVRPDAVVGRVGGEEFLIADAVAESEPQDLGREICDAIAGLPFSVTASVGIASMRCDHLLWGRDPADAVANVAAAADAAMYSAKRAGGNQFRYHRGRLARRSAQSWRPNGKRRDPHLGARSHQSGSP